MKWNAGQGEERKKKCDARDFIMHSSRPLWNTSLDDYTLDVFKRVFFFTHEK